MKFYPYKKRCGKSCINPKQHSIWALVGPKWGPLGNAAWDAGGGGAQNVLGSFNMGD